MAMGRCEKMSRSTCQEVVAMGSVIAMLAGLSVLNVISFWHVPSYHPRIPTSKGSFLRTNFNKRICHI
jgi:hypothetical protein